MGKTAADGARALVDRGFGLVASTPAAGRLLARNTAVATVFHQIVDSRRPHEGTAFCNQLRSDFHDTMKFLASIQSASTDLWITFDDGYAMAAEILNEIAPRYPTAKFVFFICPEKTSAQVGFRWDAWERQNDLDGPVARFNEFAGAPVTPDENRRTDLLETAADPRFRLATVSECLALEEHPNVQLGNHSNRHIELSTMSAEDAAAEIRESAAHFAEIFGSTEHFAFPYGTPGVSYDEDHVALLRSLGYRYLWSTRPLGFDPADMTRIIIPRIPVSGLRSASQTRANIVKYLVKTKLRRP